MWVHSGKGRNAHFLYANGAWYAPEGSLWWYGWQKLSRSRG